MDGGSVTVGDSASLTPVPGDPQHEQEQAQEQPKVPGGLNTSSGIQDNSCSSLVRLPPELLHQILSYLSATDLARVSLTCRSLAGHTTNDLLWADVVNLYLPFKIYSASPFESFRALYVAYHPCWFIPRNKIWFSDTEHTGNLILARFDPRRGVIEAYRVIAERRGNQFQVWEWNPDVIIQTFHPKVSLWLDDPVLLLKNTEGQLPRYCHGETRMPMAIETQHVFNAFSLCSPELPPHPPVDSNKQWPPPTIPSDHRVYRDVEMEGHRSNGNQRCRDSAQISEHAFRIRRWAHFRLGMPMFTAGRSETLSTYGTLDPSLYTPTREKPYQGIWVGDYSAHGCEFLLFIQRDHDDHSTTSINEPEPGPDEVIQRGSLEAIKLTGDPNVPRGQLSFIANDIGPRGLVRIADEAPYQGSRIVRSKGHVAGIGFRDDTFISSQLILISPDCVAHYWEAMGHISYLRRLDIDSLIQT
ncbi:F-box protein [Aspergillus clavatus NRRL 1]|uniref:F-box domain protein n=1 Tax=Aspergillus clavatus (strain ATCC 1007 / CBS 513.65 / DSM 816 / NCTC 3887 / NRRL 1 / QM 1276 / 107) TaxID=344612 RepID=A1CT32_ASPCL|nr:F-box domain protein [Aspergillus clavatus NRRL 1]EAW06469.1 F-box domain protein [Aspergillus clavatus NRRL 1]